MIKIHLPSNNLNCYGLTINLFIFNLYMDIFRLENKFKGFFISFKIPNKTSLNIWFYFNGFIKVDIWYLFNKSYKLRFKLYPIKRILRIYDYINGNCIYSNQKGYIDKTLLMIVVFTIAFIIFIISYNMDTVINGIPVIKQLITSFKSLIQALNV